MTSTEYIQQIENLMNQQDNYVNWVLAIVSLLVTVLGIVIALAAYYQWWLNTKQMERLKEETKRETIKEIEGALGDSNLKSFKIDIEKQIEDIKKERDMIESSQLFNKIMMLQYEEKFLWRIPLIMDEYNRYISNNIRNFNYFVEKVLGLIVYAQNEGKLKEGIDSDWIDKILEKITRIEASFNEKSESLEKLTKQISIYRKFEK